MTMYLPNSGVRPTGSEPAEFLDIASMSGDVEFGSCAPSARPEGQHSNAAEGPPGTTTRVCDGLDRCRRDATVNPSSDTRHEGADQ
jgi:hypothetical protein